MFSSFLPAVAPPSVAFAAACPYRNANSSYCSASIMKSTISKRQNTAYCTTENFDSCPVFLGKVLRGARSGSPR